MNVEYVHIRWQEKFPLHEEIITYSDFPAQGIGKYRDSLVFERDGALYTINRGSKILYIGKAYRQSVRNRFAQHWSKGGVAWKIRQAIGPIRTSREVTVGVGLFKDHLSERRVDEAENLLICHIEPEYNKKSTNSYSSMDNPFIIVNTGKHWPLAASYDSRSLSDKR